MKEKLLSILIDSLGFMFFACLAWNGFSQGGAPSHQVKDTSDKADKHLKSAARINPSTLAMELNMPLASYPGRSGNSIPFGFEYSSKVWRMDEIVSYSWPLPYSCNRQYLAQIRPIYGERTAAGWTNTSSFPTVEEKPEIFDQEGRRYPFDFGEEEFNSSFLEAIQNGENQSFPPDPTSCGWNCTYSYNFETGQWTCLML